MQSNSKVSSLWPLGRTGDSVVSTIKHYTDYSHNWNHLLMFFLGLIVYDWHIITHIKTKVQSEWTWALENKIIYIAFNVIKTINKKLILNNKKSKSYKCKFWPSLTFSHTLCIQVLTLVTCVNSHKSFISPTPRSIINFPKWIITAFRRPCNSTESTSSTVIKHNFLKKIQ